MNAIEELHGERLARANDAYAAVHFEPSQPERDRTFGVFAEGVPIALGRYQRYADGAIEIGGFWVHAAHRRHGLARRMVKHVIGELPPGRTVWCLPFSHLVDFYRSFGFERTEDPDEAPASILRKTDLCTQREAEGVYHKVDLLVHNTSPARDVDSTPGS
ncbi:MAG: GNAT family N-acetyltransferase [bacterium]|nr:GNAT family N-acetyltransferase [bacterium]